MNKILDLDSIRHVIYQNGPEPKDYTFVNNWFNQLLSLEENYGNDHEDLKLVKEEFHGLFFDARTMFGHVLNWPYGYPGDYIIIDRIYKSDLTTDPDYQKWDLWFHQLEAPKAVRNRKTYFKQLIASKTKDNQSFRVLNLASGPCRDLLEALEEQNISNTRFDCIEIDPNAVTFAKTLLKEHLTNVKFHLANVFKYDTLEQYDLIWSAGLFDYFDDKTFVSVLQRYRHNLNPGGEIVVGNFYVHNPTMSVMHFFGWRLNHRTYDHLIDLAIAAGYHPSKIRIESEPEGVNLFLRIRI